MLSFHVSFEGSWRYGPGVRNDCVGGCQWLLEANQGLHLLLQTPRLPAPAWGGRIRLAQNRAQAGTTSIPPGSSFRCGKTCPWRISRALQAPVAVLSLCQVLPRCSLSSATLFLPSPEKPAQNAWSCLRGREEGDPWALPIRERWLFSLLQISWHFSHKQMTPLWWQPSFSGWLSPFKMGTFLFPPSREIVLLRPVTNTLPFTSEQGRVFGFLS